ncbi:loricrin isoform X2 [Nematostella vectensis]|uniref:loricrin isoform X2 n=1 Tax=Nematostella vectensis TaxID=45351 RepID=UPI002076DFCB|nr:loricrin isoform X2 [Nematostella vectensis]
MDILSNCLKLLANLLSTTQLPLSSFFDKNQYHSKGTIERDVLAFEIKSALLAMTLGSGLSVLCLLMSIATCLGQNLLHEDDDYYRRSIIFVAHQGKRLLVPISAANTSNETVTQKSLLANDVIDCSFECLAEKWCHSLNVKLTLTKSGQHVCELISTDRYNQPQYLVQDNDSVHFGIKSPCEDSPCKNGDCVTIYHEPFFHCACPAGFTGQTCSADVAECGGRSHGCHANASCINIPGSYRCACKDGFTGDGKTCFIIVNQFDNMGHSGRSGLIQTFRVPKTGLYRIEAGGASGGTHCPSYGDQPGTYYGGKGAIVSGIFTLINGTELKIVVGLRGGDSVEVQDGQSTTMTAAQLGKSVEDNAGTGGGGGSFVYTSDRRLLVIAGGGGGASNGYNGVDGQSGENGYRSSGTNYGQSRAGGTGGNPGECNSAGSSYHGGVGAGWDGTGCTRLGPEHGERGGSIEKGWVGGRAGGMNSGYNGGPAPGAVGGFGGGGGGSEDNGASGGGGGYSGGGSGTHSGQAGGGGGSYCGGSSCSAVTGGNSKEYGFLKITYLGV